MRAELWRRNPVATDGGYHRPVMVGEVLDWLRPRPGVLVFDLTVGGGGHSEAILEHMGPRGRLVGVDRDQEAVCEAQRRLAAYPDVRVVKGNFGNLAEILDRVGVERMDGVLMDLGVSSRQLDSAARGFSFREEAELDMRMDRAAGATAAELLAEVDEQDLVDWLRDYGEERFARRIARAIVQERAARPVRLTTQLADVVVRALPASFRHGRIHPATRTFQALRLVVNAELPALESCLREAAGRLNPEGRVVVLSYHSLEDRLVKNVFRSLAGRCVCPPGLPECRCRPVRVLKVLTAKPVRPSEQEVASNPRSRSARLRAAVRIAV